MYMKKHPCEKSTHQTKAFGLLVVLGLTSPSLHLHPIHVIVSDDPHKGI